MTSSNEQGPFGPHQGHLAPRHDPNAPMMAALNDIKSSVAAIASGQIELAAKVGKVEGKVDKIDENLNGDGSLDDPGIAGEVRSLRAWKKRDEDTIADLKAWKTSQSAIWRQVLIYLNIPLGLAVAALWSFITTGHAPPGAK